MFPALAITLSGLFMASMPADRIRYSVPRAFWIERSVEYSNRAADIHFTLHPRFNLKTATITLRTSHDGLWLRTDAGPVHQLSITQDFSKGKSYSFSYKVQVKKPFTMASVTVLINYPFPEKAMTAWIAEHTKDRYPLAGARQKLYGKLPGEGAPHEERFGIFLYGRSFPEPNI